MNSRGVGANCFGLLLLLVKTTRCAGLAPRGIRLADFLVDLCHRRLRKVCGAARFEFCDGHQHFTQCALHEAWCSLAAVAEETREFAYCLSRPLISNTVHNHYCNVRVFTH